MSFLTINRFRRFNSQRLLLVLGVLLLAAALPFNPSVLALLRITPESIVGVGMPMAGYISHLVVYFVLTLLVMCGLRPEHGGQDVAIVSTLLVHAALAELVQRWLPGGHWDLFHLACNMTAVPVAASLYLAWSCGLWRVDRAHRGREHVWTPRDVGRRRRGGLSRTMESQ